MKDLKNKTINPLVSILIPSYNHDMYIEEALDSCLNQTYDNFEILVLDDGSSDNSVSIIKKYADKFPKKIKFFQQQNSGVAKTLNKLINLSRGKYLSLMASDDILYPTKLEKQVAVFNKDIEEKVGFVYSYADQINMNKFRYRVDELTIGIRGKIIKELFENGVFFSPVSNLIRKSAILECGMFKVGRPYCDDYQLYMEIALKYEFDFVPEKLVARRIHYTNTSLNQIESINGNKEMLIDFAKKHDLVNRYNVDLERRIAILDLALARHYFINKNYQLSRKILFPILIKYPSLIFKNKSSIPHLILSYMPSFIINFIKKIKIFERLFLAN